MIMLDVPLFFVGGGVKKNSKELSVKPYKPPKKDKMFLFADMVAAREKEKAWLLYQESFLDGRPADDAFWKLVWQIKMLSMMKKGQGSDVHPYVYMKNKRNIKNFSERELDNFMLELSDLHRRNRFGSAELAVGVEKFILKL